MTNPYQSVRKFHEAMGQPVADRPQFLTPERQEFRLTLIDEEYGEFLESLAEGDLVNAFKEMADMIYVIAGMAVEMGGDLDKVFDAVQESNMSKLGDDGKPIFREDGKVLKGPNYKAPDIKAVLE